MHYNQFQGIFVGYIKGAFVHNYFISPVNCCYMAHRFNSHSNYDVQYNVCHICIFLISSMYYNIVIDSLGAMTQTPLNKQRCALVQYFHVLPMYHSWNKLSPKFGHQMQFVTAPKCIVRYYVYIQQVWAGIWEYGMVYTKTTQTIYVLVFEFVYCSERPLEFDGPPLCWM